MSAAARVSEPARSPLVFVDEGQRALEREESLQRLADLREQIGEPRSLARAGVSDAELFVLGIAVHEAAHAAVGVACGDHIECVRLVPGDLSGRVYWWPREGLTPGSILGQLAVNAAGVEGFIRATGDLAGGYASGGTDRKNSAPLLASYSALTGESAETAERVAMQIIDAVLSDPECWRSMIDLAFRLIQERRIDGADVHAAIRVPDHLRAYVATLVA